MINKNKPLVLGKLGSAYGVKGMIRVISSTEKAESIFDYKNLYLTNKAHTSKFSFEIEYWKFHNNNLVAKLKGYSDRDLVRKLTDMLICVDPNELPPLEKDFYWKDIISCDVYNQDDYHFGKVTEILETGSNDVLIVKATKEKEHNQKETLIPFIEKQVILNVDITNKTIKVNWDKDF